MHLGKLAFTLYLNYSTSKIIRLKLLTVSAKPHDGLADYLVRVDGGQAVGLLPLQSEFESH